MRDETFEWHDKKAARNWRSNGISFEMTREAFKDRFAVVWVDDHHDGNEERFALLGQVNDRLLFVSYTLRGERTRIISARRAAPHERRRYHNQG